MLINSPNISGSLTVTGNSVISGSLTVVGGINAAITGSATSASYVEYSNVANKPTLVSGSGQISFNGITDKPTLVSGSSQVSFNGITDKPTLVSGSSQITYSGLSSIPSGIVSGSAQITGYGIFATTSSNTFQANQVITGSLFISQNLVVAGSSSIQYISSSIVDIADNIITVNAFNPGVRFGGLAVIDSGSSPQVSGSLLFDSIKDQWIFIHETPGTVTSSILLMGPETYNDLGNESYISANRLPKGSGVEHLRDSNITDTGTVVSVNSNTTITGSFTVITGSAVELQVTNTGVNIGNALIDSHIISGSLTVNPNGLFVSGSGNVGIGTTNPLGLLHITPPSVTGTRVDGLRLSKPITNAANYLAFQQGGNGWRMGINYNDGAYPLVFLYGASTPTAESPGTEFMRITSGGNVGIGSTSPSEKLEVQDGFIATYHPVNLNSAGYGIKFYTNGGGSKNTIGEIAISQVGTARSGDLLFLTSNAGAPTTKMTITSGGRIGIGTTTPDRPFELYNATTVGLAMFRAANENGAAISIKNDQGTNDLSIYSAGSTAFGVSGWANNGIIESATGIVYSAYNGNHIFQSGVSGRTERMRITSSGITIVGHTAGVGTNFSPPIQVKGGAGIGNGFGIISANNEMVGGLQLASSGTNSFNITADPDNLRSSTEIGFIIDGTQRMLITSGGTVQPGANGTQDLGSTSFAWANIYTNDLHLSNMNKEGGNDIDGTSGTWTIQEGAEDLYIINNRNNKKFKIKLEEII
jgi:hypothetical protein